jgi:hypothetical protein
MQSAVKTRRQETVESRFFSGLFGGEASDASLAGGEGFWGYLLMFREGFECRLKGPLRFGARFQCV